MCGKKYKHDESLWKDAEQKTRLEKTWGNQLIKGQYTVKYLIFREIWKIPCVV